MSAFFPILLCGGGLVLCWLVMGRMHRRDESGRTDADFTASSN